MLTIERVAEMQAKAESYRKEGKRIGLVPTMGSLHEGHVSLIQAARARSDVVIVTIFVNPTQFGPGEDYERYPRDAVRDQGVAEQAGADVLFMPQVGEIYPSGFATFVEVEDVSSVLEGRFRPNHFRGVTTIVAKLFAITKPHVAVFGQKDAQQAFLIRKMAEELNFDVSIIVAPIVREADGLALSSRNVYLNANERTRATSLHRSLRYAESLVMSGERSAGKVCAGMSRILSEARPSQIDYIAALSPESFSEIATFEPPSALIAIAVRFGSTRLIDNIVIPISEKREAS